MTLALDEFAHIPAVDDGFKTLFNAKEIGGTVTQANIVSLDEQLSEMTSNERLVRIEELLLLRLQQHLTNSDDPSPAVMQIAAKFIHEERRIRQEAMKQEAEDAKLAFRGEAEDSFNVELAAARQREIEHEKGK